jgi:hypothetical protein
LEAGVELLASPYNPEVEIARRLGVCEKHAVEEAAKAKALAKARAEAEAAAAFAAKERTDFKADLWAKLDDLQHFALRLAVAVESRDAKLAASIRSVVNQSIQESVAGIPADFPRATWDKGLSFPVPPPRSKRPPLGFFGSAASVIATIPKDRLQLLRILHGDNDPKIAKHWLDTQAAADAADEEKAAQAASDAEMDRVTASMSKAVSP